MNAFLNFSFIKIELKIIKNSVENSVIYPHELTVQKEIVKELLKDFRHGWNAIFSAVDSPKLQAQLQKEFEEKYNSFVEVLVLIEKKSQIFSNPTSSNQAIQDLIPRSSNHKPADLNANISLDPSAQIQEKIDSILNAVESKIKRIHELGPRSNVQNPSTMNSILPIPAAKDTLKDSVPSNQSTEKSNTDPRVQTSDQSISESNVQTLITELPSDLNPLYPELPTILEVPTTLSSTIANQDQEIHIHSTDNISQSTDDIIIKLEPSQSKTHSDQSSISNPSESWINQMEISNEDLFPSLHMSAIRLSSSNVESLNQDHSFKADKPIKDSLNFNDQISPPLNASTNFNLCKLCPSNHSVHKCRRYWQKSADDRILFITQNNICQNCLGYRHSISTCDSATRCKECQKKHHTSIHYSSVVQTMLKQRDSTPETKESSQTLTPFKPTLSLQIGQINSENSAPHSTTADLNQAEVQSNNSQEESSEWIHRMMDETD